MIRQLSAWHFIPLCRASAIVHARLRQRVPYGVTIFSSLGLYHCPSALRAQAFLATLSLTGVFAVSWRSVKSLSYRVNLINFGAEGLSAFYF